MQKHRFKSFAALCLKAKNADALSQLFDCFLTIEEKEAIADRYAIVKALLAEKQTQREIAQTLHVSIAKITRGSNAIKLLDLKLKAFLQKN